jgi:carboxyl-terminal processing protease
MNRTRISKFFVVSLIAIFSFVFISASNSGSFFEVTKQLDIFSTLYKELNTYYVDTINTEKLFQVGIRAMCESLDPYTDFIPEDDIQEYRQQTTGRYGGIGSLIGTRGEFVIITDPYEDFPAAKAGLRAGDKIIEIDGKSVKKENSDIVSKQLRGKAGTNVVVKILRPQADGSEKEQTVTLTREEIKIKNVPYYGVVRDGIGYIRLNSFTERAGMEVRNAIIAMIAKNKIQGLVLDLRGNPGGLLNEAINVTNCFVDKGKEIVSTRGRIANQTQTHLSTSDPVDTRLTLAVLVDEGSASASEIVSGALQDYDRAIVLGERTFGKGLVQSTHSLPFNAKLKVTTAKYYIPSGRCIQAINYSEKKDDGSVKKREDSLKVAFKTKGGRIVYDGVGIDPDIKVSQDTLSQVTIELFTQNFFFDYAVKYRARTPAIANPKNFSLTDADYNDFVKFVTEKNNFKYTTKSEKLMEQLKTLSQKENSFQLIDNDFKEMSAKLEHDKKNNLMKEKESIKPILEQEICAHYYMNSGRIEATIKEDKEVAAAIDLLKNELKVNLSQETDT